MVSVSCSHIIHPTWWCRSLSYRYSNHPFVFFVFFVFFHLWVPLLVVQIPVIMRIKESLCRWINGRNTLEQTLRNKSWYKSEPSACMHGWRNINISDPQGLLDLPGWYGYCVVVCCAGLNLEINNSRVVGRFGDSDWALSGYLCGGRVGDGWGGTAVPLVLVSRVQMLKGNNATNQPIGKKLSTTLSAGDQM
jgi:hypothetical protein